SSGPGSGPAGRSLRFGISLETSLSSRGHTAARQLRRPPLFRQGEGGEIEYGEHAMSPSRFANLQGSGNRNAWKAVWVCLPGSADWLLVDVCRSARQAAIARLIGDGTQAGRTLRAREKTGERERRVAERRTSRGTANGKRILDRRYSAARESTPYPGDIRESAPRAPFGMNISCNQRKGGTGRNGRRKRIATRGLY
ncbi:MAG TPA: hypothetical protein VGF27_02085, partial [Pseudoduganella sp.]